MDPLNNQNQQRQGTSMNGMQGMQNNMANSTRPMGGMNNGMGAGTAMLPAHHSHKRLYWLIALFFIVSFAAVAYLTFCINKDVKEQEAYMQAQNTQMLAQQQAAVNANKPVDTSDIQNASSASASIDAFLDESGSVPDGTDFNDSMSDLGQ